MAKVTNALVVIGVAILFVASLSILVSVSGDKRQHRLGATLLPAWCVSMLIIYGLRLADSQLQLPYGTVRANIALGLVLSAWALLDVSRLSREYGTTTLRTAVDIAKGLMLSSSVKDPLSTAILSHAPVAVWLKGPGGIMLMINREYENKYGKPASDYAGERDSEMWGEEVGGRFCENDLIVLRTGRSHHFFESAPTPEEPERVGEFIKFPVYNSGGHMVGVGGIEVTR